MNLWAKLKAFLYVCFGEHAFYNMSTPRAALIELGVSRLPGGFGLKLRRPTKQFTIHWFRGFWRSSIRTSIALAAEWLDLAFAFPSCWPWSGPVQQSRLIVAAAVWPDSTFSILSWWPRVGEGCERWPPAGRRRREGGGRFGIVL